MTNGTDLTDLQRLDKEEREWEFDNLPNRLTLVRVALVPVVITLLYLAAEKPSCGYIACVIFGIASITDYFDGYFARKRGIITVFGSFLDPIADKFLVISSLVMLQYLGRVPALVVVILVLRELYVTSLRLLAREKGLTVPVDGFGKWKTTFQMVAIPLLMAHDKTYIPMPQIGTGLIYLASLLSLFSSVRYSWGLFKKLQKKRLRKLRALKILKRTLKNGQAPAGGTSGPTES